jgi:iron complex outermembrane recepter protein
MRFRTTLLVGAATAALVSSGGAFAATADAGSTDASTIANVGEVVVTARKRTENIQTVPAAVTSLSGVQLEQRGVRQVDDLQRAVPSLTVGTAAANATSAVFSLRGQTSGDDLLTLSTPVGIYEDSGNVPHPDGLNGAFFDIARVEVLKGPQGTLYGRNTTGGAINIITRGADYDGVHGFGYAEYGNDRDGRVGAAINLPIVDDKLSIRLAGQWWAREGYGQSLTTRERLGGDHDDFIGRLSVRFDPTSNFTSTTKIEYTNLERHGTFSTLVAVPAGNSSPALEAGLETGCGSFANISALIGCGSSALAPWVNNGKLFTNGQEGYEFDHVQTLHFVEDATWNITPNVSLRSITSAHYLQDFETQELDASPFQILEVGAYNGGFQPVVGGPYPHPEVPDQQYHDVTQEFDFAGKAFDNRLNWLVGAFGSWENGFGGEPFIAFGALTGGAVSSTTNSVGEDTNTWGIYTQEDFQVTEKLSFTGGLRYSQESQTNNDQLFGWSSGAYNCEPVAAVGQTPIAPFRAPNNNPNACPLNSGSEKAKGVSYLASVNYQLTPATLVYFKTSKGFRGGAVQLRVPALPPAEPETATDYEVGFKSDFFDHRLRTNLAAYHTDYANKQETIIVIINNAPETPIVNAATATINGFEAEVTAVPVNGWTIYGNATYLDGKYSKFGDAHCGTPAETAADKCALTPEGVSFNASGSSFPDPTWRYAIGSSYEHDLGPDHAAIQVDWAWRGPENLSALNTDSLFSPTQQQHLTAAVGLLNAHLEYNLPQHGSSIQLFATNLLNNQYQTIGLFSGALGIGTATTQEPRMFGVSFRKTFGRE